jgi:hypothetical protein
MVETVQVLYQVLYSIYLLLGEDSTRRSDGTVHVCHTVDCGLWTVDCGLCSSGLYTVLRMYDLILQYSSTCARGLRGVLNSAIFALECWRVG